MDCKKNSGFTLIEMMIVVGIMLLIAGVVAWNVSGTIRPQRVRAAADRIVTYLETARSEAMKQQVFPYLLTQGNITPYTTSPFYWPFIVQLHPKTVGDSVQYYVSVEALDLSGVSTPVPPPSDGDHSNRTNDLYPRISLPEGIVLLDPADDTSLTNSWVTNRPQFWKKQAGDFVTGSTVGGSNGIAVCDALDNSIRVEIIIDPVYGTLTIKDETR